MAGTMDVEDSLVDLFRGFVQDASIHEFARKLASSKYNVPTLLMMPEGELDDIFYEEFPEATKGERRGFKAAIWSQKQKLSTPGLSTACESAEGCILMLSDASDSDPRFLDGGQTSKRARISDDPSLQSFVQSASRHYRQWEQAENSVEEAGVGEEGHKNFLVVSADPFGNFPEGFLIWVRKCYKDLKEILARAEASQRFTLLGTAGIGKSMFTIFWICYLATLKKKVVWKLGDDDYYLLDFSEEGSSSENAVVYGPFEEDERDLGVVHNDPTAWLIIDGRQHFNLDHRCHILLACSARKENYKEFFKNQMVTKRYIPVWAKEEIVGFLDDFEVARDNYSQMNVPVKEDALGYFEKLGGVARFVVCGMKTEERLFELDRDIRSLGKDTCLKVFTGEFEEKWMSDSIVHMKCRDGKYDTYFYDFASSSVQDAFGNGFINLSRVAVVDFLKTNADNPLVGNSYGFILELVGHAVMQRGGEFQMKKVGCKGERLEVAEDGTLKLLDKMKVVIFRKVEELDSALPNTYYKPSVSNFESIDAVVTPDILLQFFSSQRGQHGYKVNGLKRLHEQLKLGSYKLCSCVPEERYKNTGYQNFLRADKTKYEREDKVLDLMDQFVVMVDYNEYKRLA